MPDGLKRGAPYVSAAVLLHWQDAKPPSEIPHSNGPIPEDSTLDVFRSGSVRGELNCFLFYPFDYQSPQAHV